MGLRLYRIRPAVLPQLNGITIRIMNMREATSSILGLDHGVLVPRNRAVEQGNRTWDSQPRMDANSREWMGGMEFASRKTREIEMPLAGAALRKPVVERSDTARAGCR